MGVCKKLNFWRGKRNVAVTTSEIATQTPNVNEEPEKITDDGGEKVKKIAELQKLLESNEKQIAALQKLLDFKDGVFQRRRALIHEMKELQRRKQEVDCNMTNEASSETPNNKHPGNKTDKKKEKMKRNTGALEQLLEFKDRVIRKQKAIIQEIIQI